jgi:peptidyl-tRNA hydrolase
MAKRDDNKPVEIGEVVEKRENPVVYIFLNKSLGMSVGKAAAQASHAAMFAGMQSSQHMQSLWATSPHKTIIVLEARNEEHIRNIETYLDQRGFSANMIVDEGVNEIDPHTITALSSQILDKDNDDVKLTFSSFDLYKDLIKFSVEIDR